MRDFTYDAIPGRVVFGAGSRRTLPAELDRLRVQHVPVERAAAARARRDEVDADTVLTIGGGSATGFGKAIALERDVLQVAVPTTYAGSEMTTIWGLTDAGTKRTGTDPRVKPELVVYDPELTLTLPPRIAGPSGMNALAHCVEALYGPGANPVVSLMALEGVRALHRSLPRVCATPMPRWRSWSRTSDRPIGSESYGSLALCQWSFDGDGMAPSVVGTEVC